MNGLKKTDRERSICCYSHLREDNKTCAWCGKVGPTTKTKRPTKLVNDLNALLCDWDRPSQLATYDLKDTISKVYTFIKKNYGDVE